MTDISFFAKTDWRNSDKIFGIRDSDRLNHIYCVGKTGVGKSNLISTIAKSDIERGHGLCVLDPHGDVVKKLSANVPKYRLRDVIYFDAADTQYPIPFNPLNNVPPDRFDIATSNILYTFKHIWADSWGPRLEHILRFCILTLLYYPKSTLLHIQPLLIDPLFRSKVLNYVTDVAVQNFWTKEFINYTPQLRSEAISPILNKVGILTSSEILRNIFGHAHSIQLNQIIEKRQILLCSYPKGTIGEDVSSVLGAFILSSIQTAAMCRKNPEEDRLEPFFVFVDEMHSFLTLSFATMLSEGRKFGIGLLLSHQYLSQLDPDVKDAVFGNVGTMITFRLGAADAMQIEQEFHPVFSANDIINLPKYAIYIKMMIDGVGSIPFSARTIPFKQNSENSQGSIFYLTRKYHAVKRIQPEFINQDKIPDNNRLF